MVGSISIIVDGRQVHKQTFIGNQQLKRIMSAWDQQISIPFEIKILERKDQNMTKKTIEEYALSKKRVNPNW